MSQSSRTAIMAAMDEELRGVIAQLEGPERVLLGRREFWLGRLHGHPVVAVLTGIGKVAASTTAVLLADHFQVSRMLFTGMAGGIGDGVVVGDVVVATAFVQHDMDASPLFPRFEVPLYGRSEFAADAQQSAALAEAAARMLADAQGLLGAAVLAEFGLTRPRVHRGLIATGDRFVSTTAECAALRAALPTALAVEMEGAAVAQVCADFGVPFVAVRTISDRADADAHVDFLRFAREVASLYSVALISAVLA